VRSRSEDSVVFASNAGLLFCGHHAHEFEKTLFEQGTIVQRTP
jgi:hypothetical protein